MSQTHSYQPFRVCYRTEVTSIIRGHHAFMEIWIAGNLEIWIWTSWKAAPDMRKEVKDYHKYAAGIYL